MTTITRNQMRPGQIVQRVTTQTYRVLPTTWAEGSKLAGMRKLDQLLPDRHEWQWARAIFDHVSAARRPPTARALDATQAGGES